MPINIRNKLNKVYYSNKYKVDAIIFTNTICA